MVRRWNGAEKLKLFKRHIYRTQFKFQYPSSSIWRGVMRGPNLKHKKNRPKNHVFMSMRVQWGWKVVTSRRYVFASDQVNVPNVNFLAQFAEEIGEKHSFFKVKKEKTPRIIPLNWLRRLIFVNVMQLWIVCRLL